MRTLHFNEEIKRDMKFVKRSEVPESGRGKVGACSVTVGGNGQIHLSKLAADFMEKAATTVLAFDGMKVYLFKPTSKSVAKVPVEEQYKINWAKKGGSATIGAGSILRIADKYDGVIYDYKSSGNQTFPATKDEKNGALVFEVVAGSLTPKVTAPRKKKVKSVAPVTVSAVEAEPELVLDAA